MKINLKTLLLTGAAVFAAWNIGMVGAFIEGRPAGSVSIGGLFGGAVISISLAVSSANIASVTGKARTKYATGFYFAMLALSVLSVAVVIWYDLDGRGIHWLPRIFLSIAYPALADVAIATAGNVTGKSFISLGEQPNTKTNKPNTKRTKANKNEQKPNETNAERTQNEQKRTDSEQSEQGRTLTEQVENVLKNDPNASLRDIVRLTEIKSTSTASRYKKEVMK